MDRYSLHNRKYLFFYWKTNIFLLFTNLRLAVVWMVGFSFKCFFPWYFWGDKLFFSAKFYSQNNCFYRSKFLVMSPAFCLFERALQREWTLWDWDITCPLDHLHPIRNSITLYQLSSHWLHLYKEFPQQEYWIFKGHHSNPKEYNGFCQIPQQSKVCLINNKRSGLFRWRTSTGTSRCCLSWLSNATMIIVIIRFVGNGHCPVGGRHISLQSEPTSPSGPSLLL